MGLLGFDRKAFMHDMNSVGDTYVGTKVAWDKYIKPLGTKFMAMQHELLFDACLCAANSDIVGRDGYYYSMEMLYAEYLEEISFIGGFLGKAIAPRAFFAMPDYSESIDTAEGQWTDWKDLGHLRGALKTMNPSIRNRMMAFLSRERVKAIGYRAIDELNELWDTLADMDCIFEPSWMEDKTAVENFTFADVVASSVRKITRDNDQLEFLNGQPHVKNRTPIIVLYRCIRQALYQVTMSIRAAQRVKQRLLDDAEGVYIWHQDGVVSNMVQRKEGLRRTSNNPEEYSEGEEAFYKQLDEVDYRLIDLQKFAEQVVDHGIGVMKDLTAIRADKNLPLFYERDAKGDNYPAIVVLPNDSANTAAVRVSQTIEKLTIRQVEAWKASKEKDWKESFAKRVEMAEKAVEAFRNEGRN